MKVITVKNLDQLYSLHNNEPVGTFAEIQKVEHANNQKGFVFKKPSGWSTVYFYNSANILNTFNAGLTSTGTSMFTSDVIIRESSDNITGYTAPITYLATDFGNKTIQFLDRNLSISLTLKEVHDYGIGGQFIPVHVDGFSPEIIYITLLKGDTPKLFTNRRYIFSNEDLTSYDIFECKENEFFPNHYYLEKLTGNYVESNPVFFIYREEGEVTITKLKIEESLELTNLDTLNVNYYDNVTFDGKNYGAFNVIGATDIDLGFTGNLTVDGGGGNIEINDVEKLSLSDVNQLRINDPSIITFEGDDEGDSKARIWVNKYPTDHLGAVTNSDGAFGLYFRKAWYIPAQFDYVGLLVNGGYIKLIATKSGTPFREALSFNGQVLEFVTKDSGYTRKLSFSEGTGAKILVSDSGATKFGIEYAADYSAGLKANPRSIIDAGTMTVMLEDYIAAVPTYADNAAAVIGGLAVGKMYKTATGELRIVV